MSKKWKNGRANSEKKCKNYYLIVEGCWNTEGDVESQKAHGTDALLVSMKENVRPNAVLLIQRSLACVMFLF